MGCSHSRREVSSGVCPFPKDVLVLMLLSLFRSYVDLGLSSEVARLVVEDTKVFQVVKLQIEL